MEPNTTSSHAFSCLPTDCIHLIFHFHIIKLRNIDEKDSPVISYMDYLGFEYLDEEADGIRDDFAFLREYGHCFGFYGSEGAFAYLSQFRDMKKKPFFYYLKLEKRGMKRGLSSLIQEEREEEFFSFVQGLTELDLSDVNFVEKGKATSRFLALRGIRRLSLNLSNLRFVISQDPSVEQCVPQWFENLRAVEELQGVHYHVVYTNFSSNFRGIRSLCMEGSDMGTCAWLQELRGISTLCLNRCSFDYTHALSQHLKDLRGIKTLIIHQCYLSFSEGWERELRGIEKLEITKILTLHSGSDAVQMTDSSFENFRGIKKLRLSCQFLNGTITNAAFVNLRGVKELCLHNLDIPHVTSEIFKQLRGIRILELHGRCHIRLDWDAMNSLQGIQELKLHVRGISCMNDDLFRFLKEVRKLHLICDDYAGSPLSERAFSYLTKIQEMKMEGLNLEGAKNLRYAFETTRMPDINTISIDNCRIKAGSLHMSPIVADDYIMADIRYDREGIADEHRWIVSDLKGNILTSRRGRFDAVDGEGGENLSHITHEP